MENDKETKAIEDWNNWYKTISTEDAEILNQELFGSMAIGFFLAKGITAERSFDLVYCQRETGIKVSF